MAVALAVLFLHCCCATRAWLNTLIVAASPCSKPWQASLARLNLSIRLLRPRRDAFLKSISTSFLLSLIFWCKSWWSAPFRCVSTPPVAYPLTGTVLCVSCPLISIFNGTFTEEEKYSCIRGETLFMLIVSVAWRLLSALSLWPCGKVCALNWVRERGVPILLSQLPSCA